MDWECRVQVGDWPLLQARAGALGSPQTQPGGDVFDRQRRLPPPHGDRHFFRIVLAPRRQILRLPAQAPEFSGNIPVPFGHRAFQPLLPAVILPPPL